MMPLKDHLLAILPCCSTPNWHHVYDSTWIDGHWKIQCQSCTLELARGFLYEHAAFIAATYANQLSLLGQTSFFFPGPPKPKPSYSTDTNRPLSTNE